MAGRRREGGWVASGCGISFHGVENTLELDSGDGRTPLQMREKPPNCMLHSGDVMVCKLCLN